MPTQSLPTVGQKNWGDILNSYLSVALNEKGSLYIFSNSTDRDAYFDSSTNHKTLYEGKVCVLTADKKIQVYKESGATWEDKINFSSTFSSTTAPSSPTTGDTYYNANDDIVYFWDGSSWTNFPTGVTGGFNNLSNTVYAGNDLTSFDADAKSYTCTYNTGRLASVNDGTNSWTVGYTGDKLTSITKS